MVFMEGNRQKVSCPIQIPGIVHMLVSVQIGINYSSQGTVFVNSGGKRNGKRTLCAKSLAIDGKAAFAGQNESSFLCIHKNPKAHNSE